MAYYTFTLAANKPMRTVIQGRIILVDDTGTAAGIDITPEINGRQLKTMPNRGKAFKFSEEYDAITLQTSVDCTVAMFLSMNDVDLGFASGSAVMVSGGSLKLTNDATTRVPVDIGGGTVNLTATNVAINNTDANAIPVQQKAGSTFAVQRQALANIVDMAPVAVGTAVTALVSDATLKRMRVRNGDPTAIIAIGGAGVTLANAAIQLQPGDVWNEDDAAGAAWYAISNKPGAVAQLQGVK